MSEFKQGEAMRLGFDGRMLTPEQDSWARALAHKMGVMVAAEVVKHANTEQEVCERLLLSPFACMYALHAAREGCRNVPAMPGLEKLRDAVWERSEP